ncbi:MAG: riboflavin synthase [Chitinophagaceae bacterium]|nr:riboflavin synthase [Chitinophagaceae bacterium]
MFTGIIESKGIIKRVVSEGLNKTFWIESGISSQLKVDQSLSHSGVCLTVETLNETSHRVTAIDETLQKTNLSGWKGGTIVNLERCLQIGGRLDGHIVQGHVDCVGICKGVIEKKGSWVLTFEFPKKFAELVVEKGSICLNGISLTVFNIKKKAFSVAIVPYTYEHTNIQFLKAGDTVNLEFDMLGKYLLRQMKLK